MGGTRYIFDFWGMENSIKAQQHKCQHNSIMFPTPPPPPTLSHKHNTHHPTHRTETNTDKDTAQNIQGHK